MKNTAILAIKFLSCIIAFSVGLDLFFQASFLEIISFSLFAVTVSYIFGDLILLPRLGNKAALAFDFLITYFSVWVFGNIVLQNYLQIAWGSIISAVIVLGAEVFVHRHILRRSTTGNVQDKKALYSRRLSYETEFAEEPEFKDHNENKQN
ncbi:YndM family protein [Bacillus sp. MUM 13]|uniref:YndM family protein n=1 Tax=Bacillus sp. MUM 13 TaxID=1678001 RepID=UPI0008F5DF97|nr:YndM family protein [Bacillus sp. MUM 13]OIK09500.1 hypothetical protein BIV59_16790 [Bacillus sp. MUM 13]